MATVFESAEYRTSPGGSAISVPSVTGSWAPYRQQPLSQALCTGLVEQVLASEYGCTAKVRSPFAKSFGVVSRLTYLAMSAGTIG